MVTKGYSLIIALLVIITLALVAPAGAAEITINPGAGAIQAGINAASDGDIIVLNPGTYSENGITITGKSLIIRSASGNRADTIIDGTSAAPRIFTVTDGSSLTIDKLTLRNGRAASGANGAGGAEPSGPGGTGGNGESGGAISSAGPVTITSSTITGCSAGNGGIGGNGGDGDFPGSPNGGAGGTGSSGGSGGAISGSTVTITSSTITGCSAGNGGNGGSGGWGDTGGSRGPSGTGGNGGSGGAISGSTVTITSSTITGCSAGNGGTGGTSGTSGTGSAIRAGTGTLHLNRIVNNPTGTPVVADGVSLNAENNWWGINTNPSAYTAGTVDSNPWLIAVTTVTPSSVTTAQTSVIRASLTFNSDGADTSASGYMPDGSPVTFTATGAGSVAPGAATTTSGAATATCTPGSLGVILITTTVDGITDNTAVTVTAPTPVTTSPTVAPTATSSPGSGSGTGSSGGSDSDSGGSSSGSSGTPGTYEANVGGNSAVDTVTVTGTGVNSVIITGTQQGSLPPGVPPVDPNTYQYIELTSARAGSITGASISFEVPVAWLDEHGLTTADVAMNRYHNGAWTTLPTTYLGTTNGIARYSAQSPGFSLFAIAPKKGGAQAAPVQQTCPSVQQLTCPVQTAPVCPGLQSGSQVLASGAVVASETPAAGIVLPETGFPLATIALIGAGCVVLAGSCWYVRRWWIRKQNPALFREYD